ncbi:MAG: EAL domain-containing protein [Bacillus sp. (in: Bacteria)]|nr:EAL domain-containing protein [Bacillus sp. (in: firmicutes)]
MIGMFSIDLPNPLNYRIINILVSLGIALLTTLLTLLVMNKRPFKYQYLTSGTLIGIGFSTMHHIGMAATTFHYSIVYTDYQFIASLLFTSIFSSLSFRVYQTSGTSNQASFKKKVTSGLYMGLALSGGHYLSMIIDKITYFYEFNPYLYQVMNPTILAVGLAIGTGMMVIFLLITSRLDWEFASQSEKIQLNEQYYKSLFEQNPDPILTFDLEGNFFSANKAVSLFIGYSIEELINKPFAPLIASHDLERVIGQYYQALNGIASTYECQVVDKQGNLRDIKVTNIPIVVNEKITGIYGLLKDITDYKKAQLDIIEAEAKYRSVVENSLVGVYVLQDEELVYVNPRLCEMSGYSHEEIMSMNLLDSIVPEDLPYVLENIMKLIKNEELKNSYQYQGYRKDKSIMTLEIYGSKIEYNGKKAIIGTVIDVTERLKAEKMIKHMAYHDQLTDLPNRYQLREKLNEVVINSTENNKKFALLFLDLDRFKVVNDTLGHEVGDKLLIEIGKKLKSCMDEGDIVARYGGDEFSVLLPDTTEIRARDIAERIISIFSVPCYLNHLEIIVTPSIGISIFPEHGENYDMLIKKADMAMYFSKSLGRNNFQFFTKDLIDKSQYEVDLEMKLRKALERNEFLLYYQPQINLETNRIIGAEALIRWKHPEKGIISPGEFIPVAEETGLIIPIGVWALRNACQQNKRWQVNGLPPITVAVNISAKQFLQSNLAEIVRQVLIETELDPKYLEIEITESMTMDVERTISTLLDLKKIGVKISIDDFGSGYSSLNYLKRFPIDKLKIDQSFIRECITDSNDEIIVKTIIAMAHNLKLQVIAEGVETKEQISFLLQQRCTEAQGFYFSKPIPVEEFENIYNRIIV